jgi:hypothetical protein
VYSFPHGGEDDRQLRLEYRISSKLICAWWIPPNSPIDPAYNLPDSCLQEDFLLNDDGHFVSLGRSGPAKCLAGYCDNGVCEQATERGPMRTAPVTGPSRTTPVTDPSAAGASPTAVECAKLQHSYDVCFKDAIAAYWESTRRTEATASQIKDPYQRRAYERGVGLYRYTPEQVARSRCRQTTLLWQMGCP